MGAADFLTDEEKRQIGLKYLVPKVLKANGLKDEELQGEEGSISGVIAG